MLERQGWEEGQGVGGSRTGIAEALSGDGQNPRDKTGFGCVSFAYSKAGDYLLNSEITQRFSSTSFFSKSSKAKLNNKPQSRFSLVAVTMVRSWCATVRL